jgi:acyl carrier protein
MIDERARDRFEREMLEWINRRFGRTGTPIDADTPLFAGRLIDSIRVLELIAWTEQAIGRPIPDDRIRMDHFRTVRCIADGFADGVSHASR